MDKTKNEEVLELYTVLNQKVEKEELKMTKSRRMKNFVRGAKASLQDKETQKQYVTWSLLGGALNAAITYAVTRDVKEAVKYGAKVGAGSYVVGEGVYALGNGIISANHEDYADFLEEEL